MNQARADPLHLVGGHARPNSAATEGHAAIYFPASDGARQWNDKTWIVIIWHWLDVAEIDHLMAAFTQLLGQM